MVAQPHRSRMSVEEYLTLERTNTEIHYEFIDGHVYMLAGGTADHSIISANIIRELSLALRGSPCRVYTSDMKVRISEQRYVYPDVSVSCDPRDRGSIEALQYPRLIVEVLSPSTEAYDRGKKFSYYRACLTIEEYILVDTQQQAIDFYRREQETFWKLSPLGSDDQVKIQSLGISFPVTAIYENIMFPENNSSV